MKTKIGSTKKLLAATVALVASLGVAAGSTFAWFTTSDSVSTGAYETTIVSGTDSLTMAVTAYNTALTADNIAAANDNATTMSAFSKVVSPTQITKYVTSGAKLAALSSADGETFTAFGGGVSTAVNSVDGGYVSYRLVLRNLPQLDEGSTETSYDGSVYLGDSSLTAGEGSTIEYNANSMTTVNGHVSDGHYGTNPIISDTTIRAYGANAARLAFTVPNVALAQGIAATTDTKTWAPNETNVNGGEATAAGTGVGAGYFLNNLARDYYNDIFNLSEGDDGFLDAASNPQVELTDAITASADSTTTANEIPVTWTVIGDYAYTYIDVKIWLEGSDGDCFDAVLTDSFTTTLQFNLARTTA